MRIAILEDDPAIGDFLTAVLQLEGHAVSLYQEAVAFLSSVLASASSERVEVCIVDLRLPGNLSGIDVIRQIRTASPNLPILLISAEALVTLIAESQGLVGVRLLQKPFTLAALHRCLQDLQTEQREDVFQGSDP